MSAPEWLMAYLLVAFVASAIGTASFRHEPPRGVGDAFVVAVLAGVWPLTLVMWVVSPMDHRFWIDARRYFRGVPR